MKAGAEEVLQQLALPKRRGTSRIRQAACPWPPCPPPASSHGHRAGLEFPRCCPE